MVRELLMAQRPEGYARACEALAAAVNPSWHQVTAPVLMLTGSADKVGPAEVSEHIADELGGAKVVVIPGIGHWHCLEAAVQVGETLRDFFDND
jgi:pimeloyl-ACP methyl ester carboxylesterase